MKKSTKDIIEAFSNQFESDMELVNSMQLGTADTFISDPDYADIIKTFAESFVNLSDDISKKPPLDSEIPKMLSSVLDIKEPGRKSKVAVFSTVLYTMIKNLHEAGIIRIVPQHERKAAAIWKGVKEKIHPKT